MGSRWIPLESNPEVLNEWASKAGLVTSQAVFEDVYGLDNELLSLVQQPVKAVVLLFPLSEALETTMREEDVKIEKDGQHPIDPTIIWIKQTISNACGTMGILHALANSDVTIAPASPLAQFIEECQDKTPLERAKLLETTPLFADIHAQAAASGQSVVPTNLDTDLHFTCFIQAPDGTSRASGTPIPSMRLIELDGRRGGPIDKGECSNFLQDVAKIVKKVYISQSSSANFSMMSLGPPV